MAELQFHEVTISNIAQLKVLNSSILPVFYNEKFYQNVLKTPDLSRLVSNNGKYIGMVCCKVEGGKMYILTLGCLAVCRRRGIGSQLLEFALEQAKLRSLPIELHVQITNEDAVNFYERFGFKIVKKVENYHRYLNPRDAYILERLVS